MRECKSHGGTDAAIGAAGNEDRLHDFVLVYLT
jgi:hypothetical protein